MTPSIAIIGGTGLTALDTLKIVRRETLSTPYGEPSGPVLHGELGGRVVAFLARHGPRHTLPPHKINYRANLWALRRIGVEIVFPEHQLDLVLGEIDIDQRQRGAVIGQVPGREPGILPFIGHGDDIGRPEVPPGTVTAPFAAVGRRELVAVQPASHVVMEELLAPDHARRGLAQNAPVLVGRFG